MNGTDYYSKLQPYFLNLAYTDNCDGQKADDLHLQLADRDNRFISDWMPDKGAFLDIGIITERWFSPNAAQLKLDCGRLWIDEIEFELPQHTVTIKASSIPTDAHVKASDETRGWDNATLRDIAQQIAGENKMSLDYRSDYNPTYSRVEQTEQSALEFLMHRARDAKLAIKVHRAKIVMFDEEQLEKASPAFALVYGNGAAIAGVSCYRIAGGKFTTKLIDTTKKATVSHVDPANGKMHTEEAIAGDADAVDDWHTHVNESTDNQDEESEDAGDGEGGGDGGLRSITPRAEGEPVGDWNAQGASESGQRLAKSKLRDKNKDMVHAEIEMGLGNPLVAAGQTFTLSGVGKYDGKWFLESAEHKVAPQYTTTLQARRCLQGY